MDADRGLREHLQRRLNRASVSGRVRPASHSLRAPGRAAEKHLPPGVTRLQGVLVFPRCGARGHAWIADNHQKRSTLLYGGSVPKTQGDSTDFA